MEEKKVVDFEANQNAEVANKKETIKEKFARKREEVKEKKAAKKAARAENPKKINLKKIGIGIGTGLAAAVAIGTAIACSKRGDTGTIDPDWECEPGDDYPEIENDQESVKEPAEEVAEG